MITIICLVINLLCFGFITGGSLANRELTKLALFGMATLFFWAALCTAQIVGDIIK